MLLPTTPSVLGSLSDFVRLSNTKTLCWENIHKCLVEKYQNLSEVKGESKNQENKTASHFLSQIHSNRGNPGGNKTILLYPGRWNTFIHPVALTLAEEIVSNTRFGVYVATQAHPLSDRHNVRELNPSIFGNSTLCFVSKRIFFTTPIGFGKGNLAR